MCLERSSVLVNIDSQYGHRTDLSDIGKYYLVLLINLIMKKINEIN